MIIPFKPQFVGKIMFGEKIHTIRADLKNRYKVGTMLHMATGVRTKNYNCFKITTIDSIQEIVIKHYPYGIVLTIDGKQPNNETMHELAKNDGFDSVKDFFKWFDKDFKGKLIHWTDKLY